MSSANGESRTCPCTTFKRTRCSNAILERTRSAWRRAIRFWQFKRFAGEYQSLFGDGFRYAPQCKLLSPQLFLANSGPGMLFLMAGFEMNPAVLRGRPIRNALAGWGITD